MPPRPLFFARLRGPLLRSASATALARALMIGSAAAAAVTPVAIVVSGTVRAEGGGGGVAGGGAPSSTSGSGGADVANGAGRAGGVGGLFEGVADYTGGGGGGGAGTTGGRGGYADSAFSGNEGAGGTNGGAGGNGGTTGGGGGGSHGFVGSTVPNGITGGRGGAGGTGALNTYGQPKNDGNWRYASAGGGGAGGYGAVLINVTTTSQTFSGTIAGGSGGDGGSTSIANTWGGSGGSGGTGLAALSTLTLTNAPNDTAAIVGGAGGTAGVGPWGAAMGGTGGAGIVTQGQAVLSLLGGVTIAGGGGGYSAPGSHYSGGGAGGAGIVASGDVHMTDRVAVTGGRGGNKANATGGTAGGAGGAAVVMGAGSLIWILGDATLIGGDGGSGKGGAIGGVGGAGLVLQLNARSPTTAEIYGNALIAGGAGGTGFTGNGTQAGAVGGAGIVFSGSGRIGAVLNLWNSARVVGGTGGFYQGGLSAGTGGAGFYVSGGVFAPAITIKDNAQVVGGTGATGYASGAQTQNGGTGGAGIQLLSGAGLSITAGSAVTGGAGGGLNGDDANATPGQGGAGILLAGGASANIAVSGSVTGGGSPGASGAGSGVNAAALSSNATITINGGGVVSGGLSTGSERGAGISGANLNVVVNSGGTIVGGAQGAVAFTGGTNTLVFNPGSWTITGAVTTTGGASTLELSGSGSGAFQFASTLGNPGVYVSNLTSFSTTGSATWTVTGGLPAANAVWAVNGGTLVLALDNSATGTSSLTVDVAKKATLQTAAATGTPLTIGAVSLAQDATLSSATVSGGSSPALILGGAMTIAAGANLVFDLSAGTSAGIATNSLSFAGATTLNLGNVAQLDAGAYLLIAGAASGTAPTVASVPTGYAAVTSLDSAGLHVTVAAEWLQWNGSATSGPLAGGSGTWSAGPATNWTTYGGQSNLAWNGLTAVFSVGTGTATVDTGAGAVLVQAFQFNGGSYEIAGGPLTLNAPSGGVSASVTQGVSATISASLAGSGQGLTLTGPGTLVLSGANTYSGTTTVASGTLVVTGSNPNSAFIIQAGGTLQVGDGTTFGSIAGAIQNDGTLAFSASGAPVFANAITGSGGVAVGGAMTLSGANSFTGGLLVAGTGVLTVTSATALGAASGTATIDSGGVLTLADGLTLAQTLNYTGTGDGNGALQIAAGDSATWSGTLSAQGAGGTIGVGAGAQLTVTGIAAGNGLSAIGGGTLVLGNTGNTFSGAIDIENVALVVAGDGALGNSANSLTFLNGSFAATSPFSTARMVNLAVGGTTTFDTTAPLAFTGMLTGAGGLNVTGSGTLTLAVQGSLFTGGITVASGTLDIANATLGAASVTVQSGGTLSGYGALAAAAVTVEAGGTLAGGYATPDNTSGKGLQLAALTLQTGATTLLAFPATTPKPANIGIANVSGSLTLGGTLQVQGSPVNGAGLYEVFTFGTVSGAFAGISGLADTYSGSVETQSNTVYLLVRDADAIQFWTADGTNRGGSGTWTAASQTWQDSTTLLVTDWGGRFGIFQGGSGPQTVTISGQQAFTKLEFATDGYTLAADGAVAGSGLALANGGILWVEGRDVTATVSASISGTGGLMKTGAGTLVLSGTNTYEGGTLIGGGLVEIASDAALGAANWSVALEGGGLQAGENTTVSTARTIILGGTGILSALQGANLTASGSVAGVGTLVKTGAGTLTLSGANTFAGATQIAAGTLVAENGAALADGSGVSIASGAHLVLANDEAIGALSGTGQVTLNGSQLTLTGGGTLGVTDFGGVITGTGGVSLNSPAIVVLTGDSSYGGGTQIAAGATLVLGAGGTSGMISGSVVNDGTLSFARSDAVTFAGAISGTGAVYQLGGGTLTLTGQNSFSGGLVVGAGTLSAASDAALGAAQGALALEGATFQATGTFAMARAVTLSGRSRIEVASGEALTMNAAIGGTGSLAKTGDGTLVIAGGGTLAGAVTVEAGTLAMGGGRLTAASMTIASGATLTGQGTFNAPVEVAGTLLGGSSAPAGVLALGSLTLTSGASSILRLDGRANGGLADSAGTLTLAGTLAVEGAPAHGAGVYRLFGYEGALSGSFASVTAPTGYDATIDAGTPGTVFVALSDESMVQLWTTDKGASYGGSGTWSSTSRTWEEPKEGVTIPWGGQTGLFLGTAGTVTIEGVQSFVKLEFAADGYVLQAKDGASGLALADSGVLWVEGHDVTAAITAGISGDGGLTKVGAGTLILSGANDFTGGLTLAGGALWATSDAALGRDGLTLAGGALVAVADITSVRPVTLVADETNILAAQAGATLHLSGAITGAGGLTIAGAGTVSLDGASSFTGGISVAAGTLAVTGTLADATAMTLAADGTLVLGRAVALGSLTGAGQVALAGNALSVNDGDFAGKISGTGTLTKTGSGRLTLTGANDFAGSSIVSQGVLQVGDGSLSGVLPGNVSVASGATLAFAQGAASTFAGIISGAGAVRQSGPGTLTLTGANSFGGGLTVEGATLIASASGNLGTTGGMVRLEDATLQTSASFALEHAIEVSGQSRLAAASGTTLLVSGHFTGDGSLELTGTGTVKLAYGTTGRIGALKVSAGTLDFALGDLTVDAAQVAGGATLAGFGHLRGPVDILSNATLAGGVSASDNPLGLALETGTLTLAPGALTTLVVAGGTNVGIAEAGNLALGGTLSVTGTPQHGAGYYRVFTYTGTLSGTLALGAVPAGYDGTIDTNEAGQVNVLLTDVTPIQVWTADGGASRGGSGTWTSSSMTWKEAGTGVVEPWGGEIAVFMGTAGTVSISGVQSFQTLEFLRDGYVLTADGPGSGLTFSGGGLLWVEGHDVTATLSAPLSGTGGLTKVGAGTLILSGGNSYAGGTTIAGGVLEIAAASALGAGGTLTFQGGALRASASLTLSGPVILDGRGTFAVADTQTLTVSGAISGAGGLRKEGAGTLVLSGTNAYAGDTTIMAGTLTALGGHALSTGGVLTIEAAGTLDLRADETVGALTGAGRVLLSGTLTAGGSGIDTVFSGILSGTGGLTKDGTGTLVLSGENTFTGQTTIHAGTLQVGTGGTAGQLSDGPVANAGTLIFERSDDIAFSGAISGAGRLVQGGTGTLVLSGDNSFTGDLVIALGTVQVADARALSAASGRLQLVGGGTLAATNSLETGRTIEIVDAGTLDVSADATLTLTGGVSGSGRLTKDGAGTLVLLSDAALGAGTHIAAGTLAVGDGGTRGHLSGAVQNDGRLVFNRSDDVTFSGTLSGSGQLVQAGQGTLFLTGTGTATGGTRILGGVLYVGHGGTSGSLAGDVVNDGTLVFDRTDAALFAGAISGAGGVIQMGRGTGSLTLSGTNSFTGGLIVDAGTLVTASDASLGAASGGISLLDGMLSTTQSFSSARTISLTGTGTFAVADGTELALSGAVTGPGILVKSGAGTLILSGANGQGGTLVTNGVLQLAADAALGTASGALALDGGTLVTTSSFTSTRAVGIGAAGGTLSTSDGTTLRLSGGMTGAGTLTKTGGGTLVVTGNAAQAGGLVIEAGTVQVGSGGTSGWVSGPIVNHGRLVYDLAATYEIASTLTGAGQLAITGGGTARFAAAAFQGPVEVSAASVVLSEGIASTASFTIGAGGLLGGSGQVGDVTVRRDGILAPGYSPGHLTVAGTLVLSNGALYIADIRGNGTADRVDVTSAASISGAGLVVLASGSGFAAGTTYTLLTAAGGLSGTFAGVETVLGSAFLDPLVSYDATSVYLTLARNGWRFADTALTVNQRDTAVAVEALGAGNGVYDAVLQLSAATAPGAFDALSGEAYATTPTLIQQQSVYVREAVGARLRQSLSAPGAGLLAYGAQAGGPQTAMLGAGLTPTLWLQGYGGWGNSFSDGNAASMTNSIGGFLMGADVALAPNVRAGLFAGFGQSQFEVADRSSTGSMDDYDLGLYAGAQFGAFALRGGLAYGWHDVSTNRTVAFPGFAQSLEAGYTASSVQAFGEVGYEIATGGIAFEPFLGLAYVGVGSSSFAESGGSAALGVNTAALNTLYGTLGVRLATSLDVAGRLLTPSVTVGWQHAFGDTSPSATMAFAGGGPFAIYGVPVAEDALLLEAGLSYPLSPAASLSLAYTGQIATTQNQNSFTAQVSIRF